MSEHAHVRDASSPGGARAARDKGEEKNAGEQCDMVVGKGTNFCAVASPGRSRAPRPQERAIGVRGSARPPLSRQVVGGLVGQDTHPCPQPFE